MRRQAQLRLTPLSPEEAQRCWAFAAMKKRPQSSHSRRRLIGGSITACSQQARRLGIHVGMRYQEAKTLVPELRVLVYRK